MWQDVQVNVYLFALLPVGELQKCSENVIWVGLQLILQVGSISFLSNLLILLKPW